MEIFLNQAIDFQNLCNKIYSKEIPIKVAYKFAKILNAMSDDIHFFQSNLQIIINRYGKKNELGDLILTEDNAGVQIKEENLKDCEKEIQELNGIKIKIPEVSFSLEELKDFNLTIHEMNILIPFIEE